jgi:hypothetical protein
MMFGNFFRDGKGGVAPLLALGIIPLVGSVGAAVDYSHAAAARTAMQAALDSTALMLSKEAKNVSGTALNAKGSDYFNANFVRPDVQNVDVAVAASSNGNGLSLTLSAGGSVKTTFLGVLGFSTIPLSVNSSAMAISDGLGCILSLNPRASGAMSGQGSTAVKLSGCSLYDNSSNATALTVGGSATISALSVGVVGGISGAQNIVTQKGIKTGVGPVKDPYAAVSLPSFSGCTEHNYTANKTATINAGVYCGGIGVNAGAQLTLNPGIYYLDGGNLSVNGGAALVGDGVTLVFTQKSSNNWATATINGNATVNLTPPNSGPFAGIVVFGDRGIPPGTTFKFNGGATQYLGGAIYIPTGAINFSGGAATSASCTQIIGDTVTFTGNSSLALNCSSYNTKPFSPTIIKLTS